MASVEPSIAIRVALQTYDWLWWGATPILGRNHRLRDGLPQRLGRPFPRGPFDIWIQAASAGESYLAALIIDALGAHTPHRVLVTTNTRQGKDIIDAALERQRDLAECDQMVSAFFPFDRPSLMQRAVRAIRPRVMVLLETEIWPGLMSVLKRSGIPIIIVNARMQPRSLRHYRIWPGIWQALKPASILAVSPEDADRYARLYGRRTVSLMPNMKFDRVNTGGATDIPNPVRQLIPPGTPFVVLGSVRREEEAVIDLLTRRLLARRPDVRIGLFPRHMHRIPAWQNRFQNAGIPYHLRSQVNRAIAPGSVVLWDVFGELAGAYRVASSAFVGGSLAPLGGQNFLEPLSCGIVPTIGPSWKTFEWVGRGLFDQGIVRVADDWQGVADALLETMAAPLPPEKVIAALDRYVVQRQGGTKIAVKAIERLLTHRRRIDGAAA